MARPTGIGHFSSLIVVLQARRDSPGIPLLIRATILRRYREAKSAGFFHTLDGASESGPDHATIGWMEAQPGPED